MRKLALYIGVALGGTFLLFGTTNCTKDKVPTPMASDCADTVHFSTQIMPVVQNQCLGCHDVGGSAPTITNHSQISANASSIIGAIHGTLQLMPQGGPALPDSVIHDFDCWVNQGKQNN